MNEYREFLLNKKAVSEQKANYYIMWISKFYEYREAGPNTIIGNDYIEKFLRYLQKNYETWQVNQAREAVRLYNYFISTHERTTKNNEPIYDKKWKEMWLNLLRIRLLMLFCFFTAMF